MKRTGKILTTIFIAGIVLAGGHFGYKYRHEIKDFFTPTKPPHTDSETIETQDINDFLFDSGSVVGYQGSSKKVTIPTTYSEQKQTNEQSYEFAMPLDTDTSNEETYNKYNAEFEVYKQSLIDQLTNPGVKGRHLRYLIKIYNETDRTTYVGDNYNYDNLEEAVNFVNSSLPKLTNSTATIKIEGITYSSGADTVVTDVMNFGLFEIAGVEELNIPATILTLPSVADVLGGNFNINVDPSNLNYSSIDGVLYNKDKTVLIANKVNNQIAKTTKQINPYAFANREDIDELIIPASVTTIGDYFLENTFVKNLTIKGTAEFTKNNLRINADNIYCYNKYLISVPSANLVFLKYNKIYFDKTLYNDCSADDTIFKGISYLYADAGDLVELTKIKAANSSLFEIINDEEWGDVTLNNYTGVDNTQFITPNSVKLNGKTTYITKIGENCFKGHTEIKLIIIPSRYEIIDNNAFAGCDNLTDVRINSASIYSALEDFSSCGGLILNAKEIRFLKGIVDDSNEFLNANFTKSEDGSSYVFTRN